MAESKVKSDSGGTGAPLVSIIMFCKDRSQTIRRAIDSILAQTYPNIEIVVQDGASTDGTREILESYGTAIKLVSMADNGNNEAFLKALQRCTGKYVGSCLSDEELLPDAVARAVDYFEANPFVDAITGDADVIDFDGKLIGEHISDNFNLIRYLIGDYCPYFVSSFFRRAALVDIGVMGDTWNPFCIEFEIWCRLGTDKSIRYVPGKFGRYGIHPQQLSNIPRDIDVHMNARAEVIDRLFSEDFFNARHNESFDHLKQNIMIRQIVMQYNHLMANGLVQPARHYLNLYLHHGRAYAAHLTKAQGLYCDSAEIERVLLKQPSRIFSDTVPFDIFALFPISGSMAPISGATTGSSYTGLHPDRITLPPLNPRFYILVGREYEQRGQIDKALDCFHHAEPLADFMIDSEACQMALKAPHLSEAEVAALTDRWARKYGLAQPRRPMRRRRTFIKNLRGGEIRVGFIGSDWNALYLQHQVANWTKCLSTRFKRYCYTQVEPPAHIRSAFDVVVVTQAMSDSAFAARVRRDAIDILHEVTGLSPHHRFRSLAQRCAPVQISYANHVGTTGIPNVDYVIGDAIAVPEASDQFFAERVWRLPKGFFCFSYDSASLPPILPPPFLENGFVTFGCFGSGGKFNPQQLALWARVLAAVPEARLILGNHAMNKPGNREYFLNIFKQHGIDRDRIRLLRGMSPRRVRQSYGAIDISFDTWPYAGGNTLAESLSQGVPAISLKGARFSAAYGASILAAAGLPDLIAANEQQFVEKAAQLAADKNKLVMLRYTLRELAMLHGLSDAHAFAKMMESAYDRMLAEL